MIRHSVWGREEVWGAVWAAGECDGDCVTPENT